MSTFSPRSRKDRSNHRADPLLFRSPWSGDDGEVGMERRVSRVEVRFPGDEEGKKEIKAWVRDRVPGAGNGARMVEEWIEW
jgi:hypothetical protein